MTRKSESAALVSRYLDEVVNAHRAERLSEFLAEDFFYVSPAHTSYTRDDFENYLTQLFSAWPDFAVKVLELHEREDVVAALTMAEATRSQVFMEIPASDKKFSLQATSHFHFRNDRIVSIKTGYDFAKLVMPS